MKKSILKYTFVALSALFILSCSSSNDNDSLDTTKPELQLLNPKDKTHFHFGDEISIEAILKDNVGLKSAKIDIHSAEDGHTHRAAAATAYWDYKEEINTLNNSKEYTFTHKVKTPSTGYKGGHYHLGVYVIDHAGNQTQQFIEIEIVNHGEDHHH